MFGIPELILEVSVELRAKSLLKMGNLAPCSGYGKMVVPGISIHVPLQLVVGTSPSSNGREQMDVNGIVIHVPLQLEVGISLASNGREQMDVTGIGIPVPGQLKVDISPSSSGRERMDATGTNIHLRQLSDAATEMCSITLLTEGALPGRLYKHSIWQLVSFPA